MLSFFFIFHFTRLSHSNAWPGTASYEYARNCEVPNWIFNLLDMPRVTQHVLSLKIRAPIILLRNINPPRICNGTRLAVKKLMFKVIEATILNGKWKHVLIPRLPVIPTDMPLNLNECSFPFDLLFDDYQQSTGSVVSNLRLNLENPLFSYGQLYVCKFASEKSHKIINFCARRKLYIGLSVFVGPWPHDMALPQVADRGGGFQI